MTERFGIRWAISSWIYSREWHGRRLHRKKKLSKCSARTIREFEHNHRADVTDPEGGFLPGVLRVGVDDRSLELQIKLEPGWQGRLVLIPEYEPKLLRLHRQGCRLEVITSIGTSHAVSIASSETRAPTSQDTRRRRTAACQRNLVRCSTKFKSSGKSTTLGTM